jgi:hypothetical protein
MAFLRSTGKAEGFDRGIRHGGFAKGDGAIDEKECGCIIDVFNGISGFENFILAPEL